MELFLLLFFLFISTLHNTCHDMNWYMTKLINITDIKYFYWKIFKWWHSGQAPSPGLIKR